MNKKFLGGGIFIVAILLEWGAISATEPGQNAAVQAKKVAVKPIAPTHGVFFIGGDKHGKVDIFDKLGKAIASVKVDYTINDGFAVGDVNGDKIDEILIAGDSSGRMDVFNQAGAKLGSGDVHYTIYDGFAVGDVNGDGKDEILVAGDDSGRIDIFAWTGSAAQALRSFNGRFTRYDGFCCGDVNKDGKDEIVIVGDVTRRCDIYDYMGGVVNSFEADVPVKAGDIQGDIQIKIGVGDVNGDSVPEIIYQECWHSDVGTRNCHSKVWTPAGQLLNLSIGNFSANDQLAVGDVNGDGSTEVIIAGDKTGNIEVFNGQGRQIMSFVGNFTKNDGFAVARHR